MRRFVVAWHALALLEADVFKEGTVAWIPNRLLSTNCMSRSLGTYPVIVFQVCIIMYRSLLRLE